LGASSSALTDTGHLVLDPFLGVGSSIVAAIIGRKLSVGEKLYPDYGFRFINP
jgi:DNA modification methylase